MMIKKMTIKKMTIKKITIINKQNEEDVKVSTCQYSSSCVRVKELNLPSLSAAAGHSSPGSATPPGNFHFSNDRSSRMRSTCKVLCVGHVRVTTPAQPI